MRARCFQVDRSRYKVQGKKLKKAVVCIKCTVTSWSSSTSYHFLRGSLIFSLIQWDPFPIFFSSLLSIFSPKCRWQTIIFRNAFLTSNYWTLGIIYLSSLSKRVGKVREVDKIAFIIETTHKLAKQFNSRFLFPFRQKRVEMIRLASYFNNIVVRFHREMTFMPIIDAWQCGPLM